MSKKEKLHLSRFTSGYFVSSLKENEKWNNIEQQYKISKEIYEDIEQLQQENAKYKEVIDESYIRVTHLLDYYSHYKALPNSIIDELINLQLDLNRLKEVE